MNYWVRVERVISFGPVMFTKLATRLQCLSGEEFVWDRVTTWGPVFGGRKGGVVLSNPSVKQMQNAYLVQQRVAIQITPSQTTSNLTAVTTPLQQHTMLKRL